MSTMPNIFPSGARGAVSLTYDDAMDVHLDVVAPDLDAAELRATFYVPTRWGRVSCFNRRLDEWRALEQRGHEIGNHTQYHPCGGERSWLKPNFRLEAYTLARMESELIGANSDLAKSLGADRPRSFAYTCCEDWVGVERTSFRPMAARLFPVARGGRERWLVDPYDCDFSYVPAWIVPGTTRADSLIDLINGAVDEGKWAVLCFHGVGDDDPGHHPREEHRTMLRHIALRADVLWCDTFLAVATSLRAALNLPWK